MITRIQCVLGCLALGMASFSSAHADDGIEFFEKHIRPILVEHCSKCHSAEAKELQGELRLDLKAGWQQGGESGQPAIVPGKPEESPLIRAVRHDQGVSEMPPKQGKLPAKAIADLTEWVRRGAPDPRDGKLTRRNKADDWEAEYRSRLDWWSLKPVVNPAPPEVQNKSWPRTDVDRFILAKLESAKLAPTNEASRHALARRLSFALTGLPPEPELLKKFIADDSPQAFDNLVTTLLDSPHFGERWARHWMDVVHYADTHGYEWDVPAKNAWRYRDYLIRAFNADVPFRQMILEQLAGDLIEPRIDPESSVNEALIGPLMLRLGERRHGDNAGAEGVTQEAVSNMIDTIGKGLLGTTLACAQCHDHKLDAIEQRDYYALAGMLMSSRFSPRVVDAVDPNDSVIAEMNEIKRQLRAELAKQWLMATDPGIAGGMQEKLKAFAADEKPSTKFPASITEFWKRSLATSVTDDEFTKERARRTSANASQLKLLADFTRGDGAAGWRWDGFGMQRGLVADGEIVVAGEGAAAIQQLLPAGRFSHVLSPRLGGLLQSPQFDPLVPVTFSLEVAAGKFASQTFIVDRALHSERLKFMNYPQPAWLSVTAGNFDSLEGSNDKGARLVYFELATKSLNNYFPPRVGYGGASEAEVADPRSWFGVTKIYQHAPGQGPQDELGRFAALFDVAKDQSDWSKRLTSLVRSAVERWASGKCDSEDVRLINDALQGQLLPNELGTSPEVKRLVEAYRVVEQKLQPERTAGSIADWHEGRNERIGIRGSYTQFGEAVERGGVRFLHGRLERTEDGASGRLEFARMIVDTKNPLVARVYVNRIWHYLFGTGLVRTPDDFGHLGEPPTHPELLDYLAARFVEEGWSTKRLIRLLVTSSVWRQASVPTPQSITVDPENKLWHHLPMRRLEGETIRDAMLAVSGRLDPKLYGPPLDPYRTAEDSQKRLFKGPLDGNGRRSVYTKMTLMEPPRLLALFNQPLPKQTVGRRDVTNVPDQALALLNDPLPHALAEHWSKRLLADGKTTVESRAASMLEAALSRPARPAEVEGLVRLVKAASELRGGQGEVLQNQRAWQDAAHAIFNLKEFIYVP